MDLEAARYRAQGTEIFDNTASPEVHSVLALSILHREKGIFMSMKLYVGNLSFSTTNDDLSNLFSQNGTVTSASVVNDRETGRSRGFGFVEMESREDGAEAIRNLDGSEFDGRKLVVNEARPSNRDSRGGGGGGGRRPY